MLVTEAIDCIPVDVAVRGQSQPGGPLLLEVQGQSDMSIAERQAGSLGQQMKLKGLCSDTTIADGVSAGLVALTQWHNGQDVDGGTGSAESVSWRAVQTSMGADTFGDTVTLSEFTPDSLASSMLPLPQLIGDDSREDRAARLLFERARVKRPALLHRRLAAIKAQGGRGKRGELVERVGRACLLMLQGESFERAAELAGFKGAKGGAGRGNIRAGDRLARAVRRLGIRFQLSLRQTGKDIARPI
jgi:hypothetical protein